MHACATYARHNNFNKQHLNSTFKAPFGNAIGSGAFIYGALRSKTIVGRAYNKRLSAVFSLHF